MRRPQIGRTNRANSPAVLLQPPSHIRSSQRTPETLPATICGPLLPAVGEAETRRGENRCRSMERLRGWPTRTMICDGAEELTATQIGGTKAQQVERVLDVRQGELCWFVGTIFMEMPLKPNVLDDISKDVGARSLGTGRALTSYSTGLRHRPCDTNTSLKATEQRSWWRTNRVGCVSQDPGCKWTSL